MKLLFPRNLKKYLALPAMLGMLGVSHGQLINLNFNGNESPPPAESGLVGPGGGLGTSWNEFNGPDSPGTLNDSTGTATSVTIDTNFGLPNTLDVPVIDLTMLRGSATNFGKGVDNTSVAINGLVAGDFYDIWLVTLRNQPFGNGSPNGTEQYVGWWSTTNSTTSPSDQLVDARGAAVDTSTFVDGYNFVLFENVEADESGNIVFTGVAGPLLDGSNNNHRLGLNGLQIEKTIPPVVGSVDAAVSAVEASPDTVFADGVLTSTVTVTLKDSDGNVVPGKDVTLANTAGPQLATIDPMTAVTTNAAGQAKFAVSSNSPGTEEFTATDVTDSNLVITQTASIEFIEVGVLTDAGQSILEASPPSVLANGSATTTVTVTLLDANGFPVSGKDVTLANSAGPGTPVISPGNAVTSDSNGEAVFTVSSSTVGTGQFTATDVTDSIGITQILTVGFIDPNAPQSINVNFTAGTAVTEAGLEGPAGGLNTRWNQYPGADSTDTVVDSLGGATSIVIDTNFSITALDNPTPLTMLRGSVTDFGKGADDKAVTINGLVAGGFYDIWLVTLRNQPFGGDGTEQYVGWWSTTNPTISPSEQLVDARSATINTSTFEEGYNFVLFETVVADESGNIVFTGVAGPLLDGSNNNHRLGLNGLQIQESVGGIEADYAFWAADFQPDDVSDRAGDFDGDGLTNGEEHAFALDPTNASSANPFSTPFEPLAGTFSYTRRDSALTGLTYTIWTSPDLETWTEDAGATAGQTPGAVVGEAQSVDVTLTATPVEGKLFIQLRAN